MAGLRAAEVLSGTWRPAGLLVSTYQFDGKSSIVPEIFLTFACRKCKQARCTAGTWWDIRAIYELKDKEFSARCQACGHQDIFFGIEAIELCHGELSPLEIMELDEEERREFGVDEEGESQR